MPPPASVTVMGPAFFRLPLFYFCQKCSQKANARLASCVYTQYCTVTPPLYCHTAVDELTLVPRLITLSRPINLAGEDNAPGSVSANAASLLDVLRWMCTLRENGRL